MCLRPSNRHHRSAHRQLPLALAVHGCPPLRLPVAGGLTVNARPLSQDPAEGASYHFSGAVPHNIDYPPTRWP